MSVNKPPLEQLWNDWKNQHDKDAANELIKNYLYLVNFHVERISSHLPSGVDKDDLKSFGFLGLYDAMKKFDPDRDLKFDTYASFRIRGAIMDGLRKEDWLPRSIRDKTKQVEQATNFLEQTYQRPPSSSEIAKKVKMTSKEVEEVIQASLFANILSIEEKQKGGKYDSSEEIGYMLPNEHAVLPEKEILKKEINEELVEGIKTLNEKEQLVISLFYHDELTLTEIGYVLGLTTSRISQIHKRAIFKLKNTLKKIQVLT